jgi:DNA polymerase III subunit epsilon
MSVTRHLSAVESSPAEPADPAIPPVSEDWVVFDLETTGLSPDLDDIIQVAAVRMRGGRTLPGDSFFSYADPGRPIPRFITQYTGVADRDVHGAPRPVEVLRQLARFASGASLIAHNGHRFDMRFLSACCQRYPTASRPVFYHDSLSLSWQVWGRRGMRHGLDAVLQRLTVSPDAVRRHDARGDVALLARAIEMMWARLEGAGQPLALPTYEGRIPCH